MVVLWSDLPPRAKLSKNFHQSVRCRRSVLPCFTIGCKQRSRNWQKTRTGQSLKTFRSCSYWFPSVTSQVQLQTVLLFLLDRQYKLLFFSSNWRAASRVFLMLNRSDSLAFVVRWTSTSGIKIWITYRSVFQLHTVSWTLLASKILAWICSL